ncbi:hypothetical protein GOODEAATRI_027355 [Goodea atripinnis]|uniref:Uncharacterized protein n=1 Tax=Goodea atripinnis TaxID=208336 RepID=A0ABV0MVK5_9TELE
MKKSSLVQNFGSEKKSKSCCADNRPADDQFLPQCLSKEDINQPCSVRAVGQVVQVCSDGTVLLELSRPSDQRFGFSISRKKGRIDSDKEPQDTVKVCTWRTWWTTAERSCIPASSLLEMRSWT